MNHSCIFFDHGGRRRIGFVISDNNDHVYVLPLVILDQPEFPNTPDGLSQRIQFTMGRGHPEAIVPPEVLLIVDEEVRVQHEQILEHAFVYKLDLFVGHQPKIRLICLQVRLICLQVRLILCSTSSGVSCNFLTRSAFDKSPLFFKINVRMTS